MIKRTVVLWATVVAYCTASPVTVTQEDLAQYVAQQQTAGIGVGQPIHRRQPYAFQPQPKAIYQSQQPKEQIYQIQPKQQAQVLLQSPKQYYQPQVEQPQPQQQYYQPQAPNQQYYQLQSSLPKKLARPLGAQQQSELPEDYDPNPQYQFGFDIKDDEFTNYQKRTEQREGDKISGSYSVVDADGFIRTVKYTADPLEGFKADVSREPTDIKIKFPVPSLLASNQAGPQQYASQGLSARKQQTQQYLGAKPQLVLRPEHTQAAYTQQGAYAQQGAYTQQGLRQIPSYAGAQQIAKPQGGLLYSQQQYEQ